MDLLEKAEEQRKSLLFKRKRPLLDISVDEEGNVQVIERDLVKRVHTGNRVIFSTHKVVTPSESEEDSISSVEESDSSNSDQSSDLSEVYDDIQDPEDFETEIATARRPPREKKRKSIVSKVFGFLERFFGGDSAEN